MRYLNPNSSKILKDLPKLSSVLYSVKNLCLLIFLCCSLILVRRHHDIVGRRRDEKVIFHVAVSHEFVSLLSYCVVMLLVGLNGHEVFLQLLFSWTIEPFLLLLEKSLLIFYEFLMRWSLNDTWGSEVVKLRIRVHVYRAKVRDLRYVLEFSRSKEVGSEWWDWVRRSVKVFFRSNMRSDILCFFKVVLDHWFEREFVLILHFFFNEWEWRSFRNKWRLSLFILL